MKKNKNISEQTLSKLFKEIPLDDPNPDFMENLLQRIETETAKSKEKKQRWMVVGQIAAGILGILFLPFLAIYLCSMFIPDFSFSIPKMNFEFNQNILTISFSILFILIIDTLLRTKAANRRKNES